MTKETLEDYVSQQAELLWMEGHMQALQSRISHPHSGLSDTPLGRQLAQEGLLTPKETVARLRAVLADYNTKWDALIALHAQIEAALCALRAQERMVLRFRYFDGLTWREVAQHLHYDEKWCRVLHNRALAHLAQKALRPSPHSVY